MVSLYNLPDRKYLYFHVLFNNLGKTAILLKKNQILKTTNCVHSKILCFFWDHKSPDVEAPILNLSWIIKVSWGLLGEVLSWETKQKSYLLRRYHWFHHNWGSRSRDMILSCSQRTMRSCMKTRHPDCFSNCF